LGHQLGDVAAARLPYATPIFLYFPWRGHHLSSRVRTLHEILPFRVPPWPQPVG
jgi:hypothetical protein